MFEALDIGASPRRHDIRNSWARSVDRAIDHMRAHLDVRCSLEELAGVVATSPFHFARLFQRTTGLPPAQYLSALRIDSAKQLLLTTDMSVTDICFAAGYNSLGTFSSRFSTLVGISPHQLRQVLRRVEDLPPLPAMPSLPMPAEPAMPIIGQAQIDIAAPAGFSGLIFLGVYDSALAHAAPVTCRLLTGPGPVRFPRPISGLWRILAAAAPVGLSALDLASGSSLLRGQVEIGGPHTDIWEAPQLLLREPHPHDPPILTALPALMLLRMAGGMAEQDNEALVTGRRGHDR